MAHLPSCTLALGAVADRGLPTPTSLLPRSTTQRTHQPEENPHVRIPTQQSIHQLSPRPNHLARQTNEGIHERLELQTQHPFLVLTTTLRLAPPPFRQRQRPP